MVFKSKIMKKVVLKEDLKCFMKEKQVFKDNKIKVIYFFVKYV